VHLNELIVGDLAVRVTWDDLEEVPIRPDSRLRQLAQLRACQRGLGHREVLTVDLDVERGPGLACQVAHRTPLVDWYQDTDPPRYLQHDPRRWHNELVKPAKAMTIRLSAEQAEQLELVADVDDRPVSDVIRAAIAEHVETRRKDETFQKSLRDRISRAQELLDG
jgi:hypothetical protein